MEVREVSKRARLARKIWRKQAEDLIGTGDMTARTKLALERVIHRHKPHCNVCCDTALDAILKVLKADDRE
jgi:hypothetical protein